MRHRTAILAPALALAALPAAVAAPGPTAANLRVSQTVQVEAPVATVRAYLDVLDNDGEPVGVLEPKALNATVGGSAATTTGLEPLATSNEGVAYIFLIDISRSLSVNEFDRIRGALELWISSLGPADRVAVIAFGEASRIELDFTNDYAAARKALAGLGPTDDLTVFHQALREGLELARRRDAGLPGRRVLVVLSDGKDEGSGLASGDMLAALRADPVPIYAIGFSRLRSENERRRYLQLLNRLASISGGSYVEAAQGTVEQSYAAMLAAVRRVWVATLSCPECRLDGESYRLQVNLTDGDRVLSDGRPVRLLPPRAAPDTTPEPAPAAAVEPAVDPIEESAGAAGGEAESRIAWWLPLLVALSAAAAAAAVAIWFLRRRKERSGAAESEDPEQAEPETEPSPTKATHEPVAPGSTFATPTGVLTSRPPKPPSLRLVRLIVVRGNRVGRQYSMMLLERSVVGARSTCDCVLIDEPGVEGEQFELLQIDGRVYIRDLARNRHTLLDGLPITQREPLETQTLVGNSDCILRVLYDEPRRVPL